ncbi:hypothetical protein PC117_g11266 [Phytophthora cactorum]|uniref:Uncharacterized protein n=1 Tax=Phytophthora cactorum TaxID=29920 RepID=A0A8T1DBM8_9STRA|nr:hypothetical protein PC117_g11266 [Phytophthora cactorum]
MLACLVGQALVFRNRGIGAGAGIGACNEGDSNGDGGELRFWETPSHGDAGRAELKVMFCVCLRAVPYEHRLDVVVGHSLHDQRQVTARRGPRRFPSERQGLCTSRYSPAASVLHHVVVDGREGSGQPYLTPGSSNYHPSP